MKKQIITILIVYLAISIASAGNYCIVTFAERRSGPDARVPYDAEATRLIPG